MLFRYMICKYFLPVCGLSFLISFDINGFLKNEGSRWYGGWIRESESQDPVSGCAWAPGSIGLVS